MGRRLGLVPTETSVSETFTEQGLSLGRLVQTRWGGEKGTEEGCDF